VYRFLFTPRWIVAHVIVVMLAITFLSLGFWQLRRLDERRLENQVFLSRFGAPVEDVEALLAAAGADYASLEYHRARITGSFEPEAELLIRSQVYQGRAGFHVLSPLRTTAGLVILVNRGWMPLEMDQPPVAAAPPEGPTTVEGVLRASQQRGSLGPVDQPDAAVLARIDLELLAGRYEGDLAPVYLQMTTKLGELPVLIATPSFTDQGPHLPYAVQWYSFTLIGLVGYGFLIRRNRQGQIRNDLDIGEPS